MVVLPVNFQVFGEFPDPLAQDRDLNFGRTGIVVVMPEILDDSGFLFLLKGQANSDPTRGKPPHHNRSRIGQVAEKGIITDAPATVKEIPVNSVPVPPVRPCRRTPEDLVPGGVGQLSGGGRPEWVSTRNGEVGCAR